MTAATAWRGWSIQISGGSLWRNAFETRAEAIQHACYELGAVDSGGEVGAPWLDTDPAEVSRAWRRLKRLYGIRVVPVTVRLAVEAPR